MNTEMYRNLVEKYDYSHLDEEYGFQERVTPETVDLAMKVIELVDVHPDSVMPYEGGIDIFWGGYGLGTLLIHVYKDEMYFSGLNKGTPDINGSTLDDLHLVREWLQSR